MVNTCISTVAFFGLVAVALSFVDRSEGFLIAGAILIGPALIAEAINVRPPR